LAACGVVIAAAAGFHWSHRDAPTVELDPAIYDEYAGYYAGQDESYVQIRRDGEKLLAALPEKMAKELQPETTSTFFFPGEKGRYVFERDQRGKVASLLALYPKFQVRATRIRNRRAPYVTGEQGIVAATTGGVAVAAGIDTLNAGGSAADAAMATALCEVVMVGGATISLAGAMQLLYFDAETSSVYYLDGWYDTPAAETSPGTIPDEGGRTAMVPGFMAVVEAAHSRFGRLPFARLFDRAIGLADSGTTADATLAWWIDKKKNTLGRFAETRKIFSRGGGEFLRVGDTFRQPELAHTLRGVAAGGAAYMYSGEWGNRFVAAVQKLGGKITLQDMKMYQPKWEPPVQTGYAGCQVYGPGLSAFGGVQMVEAFNLLAAAEVHGKGRWATSAEALVWLMQIGDLDRQLGYGKHRVLGRELTRESRLSTVTAEWMHDMMRTGKWPWLQRDMAARAKRPNHSSGVVAVDRWGNMAVVAHTINTNLWGDTGLFVDGVSIPDSARHNRAEIAEVGPGKRLPGRMVPIMILRDGKPYIGSSATGVGHIKTMQVLLNMLDFGMDPRTAVDAPAFLLRGQVAAGTFSSDLIDQTRTLGMPIEVVDDKNATGLRGNWLGVQWDADLQQWRGAATLGPPGQVKGY